MKLRIGLVGLRFGASFPFSEHPQSALQAICDLRADRRRAVQEARSVMRAYERYEDLLADDTVDAVALFTPAPLHAAMAMQALRVRKHVLCAVPAATTLRECEDLVRAVEDSGCAYMMAETSYYYPGVMACRRWREEGRFGAIFYSEAEYFHDKTELRSGEPVPGLLRDENLRRTWRWGFPPMHYITHSSSGVISVTGERLTEVAALGWSDARDERLRQVMEDNPYHNPFASAVALFKTSGGHAARIVHEFVTAVREGRWPAVNVYEAVAYTAPGICAHESALRHGEWVAIPDFGRAPA